MPNLGFTISVSFFVSLSFVFSSMLASDAFSDGVVISWVWTPRVRLPSSVGRPQVFGRRKCIHPCDRA